MSKFSISEFNEFLRARNASKPCEACGTDNWELFEHPTGELGIPIHNWAGEWNSFPSHVPVIGMVCANCGNIRLHAKRFVEKFFEDQQGRGDGNGR